MTMTMTILRLFAVAASKPGTRSANKNAVRSDCGRSWRTSNRRNSSPSRKTSRTTMTAMTTATTTWTMPSTRITTTTTTIRTTTKMRKKRMARISWTTPKRITSASPPSTPTVARASTTGILRAWTRTPVGTSRRSCGNGTGASDTEVAAGTPGSTGRRWTPWRRKRTRTPAGLAEECSGPEPGTEATAMAMIATRRAPRATTTRSMRPTWTERTPSTSRPSTCRCGNGSPRTGPAERSSANSEPFCGTFGPTRRRTAAARSAPTGSTKKRSGPCALPTRAPCRSPTTTSWRPSPSWRCGWLTPPGT
mmetsp:Transcript_25916/g.60819  ORF Transcript_25916/g.60819 Transcript_25916/m.60819 type:complete len:307 (-) Transcript_25916:2142-3062(-)